MKKLSLAASKTKNRQLKKSSATKKIPATEFSKRFGQYRELVYRHPIGITIHERIVGYFISSDDYDNYRRLKRKKAKTKPAKKSKKQAHK